MRYMIHEHALGLGQQADIIDENGEPVLRVDGKLLALHERVHLRDAGSGEVVAEVARKLAALRPTFEIAVAGQPPAELTQHLLALLGERFTITQPPREQLEIDGDLLSHEFTVRRGEETVATVSKRWFSVGATYGVDVAPGGDDLLILASVLALDLANLGKQSW